MSSASSIIATLSRALPWGALSTHARAAVGVQLRGDQLACARVTATDGGPRVEHLRWTLAESARRFEAVRRLAHTGALRDARVRLVLSLRADDRAAEFGPELPWSCARRRLAGVALQI